MPFPVAHGFTSAGIVSVSGSHLTERRRAALLVSIILGNLPDADFGFVWFLGWDESWHRGFAHSLLFAAFVGAAAAFAFSRFYEEKFNRKLAALFIVVTASHGILDTITTVERQDGVELFWLFNGARLADDLFHYQFHFRQFRFYCEAKTHYWDDNVLHWTAVYELLIFGSLFVLLKLALFVKNKFASSPQQAAPSELSD